MNYKIWKYRKRNSAGSEKANTDEQVKKGV